MTSWKALFSSIGKELAYLKRNNPTRKIWIDTGGIDDFIFIMETKRGHYLSGNTFAKLPLYSSTFFLFFPFLHVPTRPLRPLSLSLTSPNLSTLRQAPENLNIPASCSFYVRSHSATSRFHFLLQIKSRGFLSDLEILVERGATVTPSDAQVSELH